MASSDQKLYIVFWPLNTFPSKNLKKRKKNSSIIQFKVYCRRRSLHCPPDPNWIALASLSHTLWLATSQTWRNPVSDSVDGCGLAIILGRSADVRFRSSPFHGWVYLRDYQTLLSHRWSGSIDLKGLPFMTSRLKRWIDKLSDWV